KSPLVRVGTIELPFTIAVLATKVKTRTTIMNVTTIDFIQSIDSSMKFFLELPLFLELPPEGVSSILSFELNSALIMTRPFRNLLIKYSFYFSKFSFALQYYFAIFTTVYCRY